MQIRKIVREDKKQLGRLLIEFDNFSKNLLPEKQNQLRKYKDLSLMSEETTERYLTHPEYIVFVADEKGILKGYIAGEIKEKKYRVYNKEGYVESWFIEEDYQDKGVGKQLFDALEEEFKKAECTHIELATHVENTKAVQIYEHMGFIKRLIIFIKPLQNLS